MGTSTSGRREPAKAFVASEVRKIGAIPLRRSDVENIDKEFVLPGEFSAMLEKIDFLAANLPVPQNEKDARISNRARIRLHKLKGIKITPVDTLFISKASDLLRRRKIVADNRPSGSA